MTHKTHAVVGLTFGFIFSALFNMNNHLYLIFAWLGALLPDIDHPKSKMGKLISIIPSLINNKWGHRGLTHSFKGIVWVGIFSIPLMFLSPYASIYLLIGYASHLFADSLTVSGVKLYYPSRETYGWKIIKTGSWEEDLFRLLLIMIVAGIGYEIGNFIVVLVMLPFIFNPKTINRMFKI